MAHHRLWQFRPPSGGEDAFARAYASDGPWAGLFSRAAGFIGTRVMRSAERSGWWLTIDSWDSADAFDDFLKAHGEAYAALDRKLEGLAGDEKFIGAYDDG